MRWIDIPGLLEAGLLEILETEEGRAWLRSVFHKPEILLDAIQE